MRWDELFADLEAQLAGELHRDRVAEIQEMVRVERSQVALEDRLRAQAGRHLSVLVAGGMRVQGVLGHAGAGWLSLSDGPSGFLVPLAALRSVEGMDARAAPGSGEGRLPVTLGAALRALVRDRAVVTLHGVDGVPLGTGTLDLAGADHLQLAVHEPDDFRRAGSVRSVRIVPLSAVAAVQGGPGLPAGKG